MLLLMLRLQLLVLIIVVALHEQLFHLLDLELDVLDLADVLGKIIALDHCCVVHWLSDTFLAYNACNACHTSCVIIMLVVLVPPIASLD